MRVGITERAETVIVLLSSRIPQRKLDVLSIDFDIGHIVLEHGGNINLADGSSDEDTKPQHYARYTQKARCMHSLEVHLNKLGRTSGKVPFEKTINKQV
jgi:hypothetical protein